jgi:hypothetical protein
MATRFPPPKWAVPGLISEGMNLLVGAPKIGKSWFSLGLATSVSSGRPALGCIRVDRGPVLYLALEDPARRLQERLQVMTASGWRPTPELFLETSCPTWSAGGEAYVSEWLDTHPTARLVIIDTFEKIRSRGGGISGGNAYAEDYLAAGRIKALADHYRVPVVVVHHIRKATADDYLALVSGTHGIAGAADTICVLERARGQADGVLHVTGRDVEEADHALTFTPNSGTWQRLDGPAADHTISDTRAAILRALREHGDGLTPAAVADRADLTRELAKKTCARMADAGQLTTDGTGRYFAPLTDPGTATAAIGVPAVPAVPDPLFSQVDGFNGRGHPLTVPVPAVPGHTTTEGDAR